MKAKEEEYNEILLKKQMVDEMLLEKQSSIAFDKLRWEDVRAMKISGGGESPSKLGLGHTQDSKNANPPSKAGDSTNEDRSLDYANIKGPGPMTDAYGHVVEQLSNEHQPNVVMYRSQS